MSTVENVARDLRKGIPLTVYDGFTKYNHTNFKDIIHKLRKRGMDIKGFWTTKNNGKRFKTYYMENN